MSVLHVSFREQREKSRFQVESGISHNPLPRLITQSEGTEAIGWLSSEKGIWRSIVSQVKFFDKFEAQE